ncbi:MAG TPA: DUF1844 domain-containing protein [Candidatus Binataceae bacterium]|nr:DUF1844 domain-containing protein [Candidatus Binataceae bacterium]
MAEEEDKERGFKVADRRRFSSEGEAKPEVEDRPAPEAAKPAQSAQAEHQTQPGPSAGAQAEASAAYQKAASSQPGAADVGPQDLTFASFVVGLSTEALALMGEMPHPATGERMNDLIGAQQLIDIIAILQSKTRGNLSHDEETLLDAILFDLRMKYVEKARQTPR